MGKCQDESVRYGVGKGALTHPQGARVKHASDDLPFKIRGLMSIRAAPVNHSNREHHLIMRISWPSESASVMSFASVQ